MAAPERAIAQRDDTPLFRIFLIDGDPLVSYGEFARVAGRVVFSLPIGGSANPPGHETPKMQLVSIPDSTVDWYRTEEYATAVRARRYAETRGDEDYALLANRVTEALNDISMTKDPKRRVAMAEEARRNLAAWPAANYGYRAADVAHLVGMLDDVVAEMRVAAGMNEFDLSLVATATPPAPVALLEPPTPQQSLEGAFRAAVVASDASDRIALLRTLAAELAAPAEKGAWSSTLSMKVSEALSAELRVEKAYSDLARRSLTDAAQRAARADVKGLQQVIAAALGADDRLGRKRPGEMAGLLATLDARLDEARRLRLERDAQLLRVEEMKTYREATAAVRSRVAELRQWLTRIRELSGPDPKYLLPMQDRAAAALQQLQAVAAPVELQAAHGLLVASLQMTRQAASLRRTAISSKDIKLAWDASAAAAGALMLAERSAGELERTISAGAKNTSSR